MQEIGTQKFHKIWPYSNILLLELHRGCNIIILVEFWNLEPKQLEIDITDLGGPP